MPLKRTDIAIVNRSFWPKNQVLGKALLNLAEHYAAENKKVSVITQSDAQLSQQTTQADNITFSACRPNSGSASSLFVRIYDAVFFMLWVFWHLLMKRPKKVYVATDPPVVVPFIVFLYAKLFRASYVYHLQDIHPEAANIVVPLNSLVYKTLKWIDCTVMRNACAIITLTETMQSEIVKRSNTKAPIFIVKNPAIKVDVSNQEKLPGFVFCGNAGRLQRIPLLIESIREYKEQGGSLPFIFAGGGVYQKDIENLADSVHGVEYLGILDADKANQVNSTYEWGLLPIDDEVTRYAFPSKTSSYLVSGSKVFSICSAGTSVASWVEEGEFGINVEPNVKSVVSGFIEVENSNKNTSLKLVDHEEYYIPKFVERISHAMASCD